MRLWSRYEHRDCVVYKRYSCDLLFTGKYYPGDREVRKADQLLLHSVGKCSQEWNWNSHNGPRWVEQGPLSRTDDATKPYAPASLRHPTYFLPHVPPLLNTILHFTPLPISSNYGTLFNSKVHENLVTFGNQFRWRRPSLAFKGTRQPKLSEKLLEKDISIIPQFYWSVSRVLNTVALLVIIGPVVNQI